MCCVFRYTKIMQRFLWFVQLDHRNLKAWKPRTSLHPGTEKPISKRFPRGNEIHVLHQYNAGTSKRQGTSQPQHPQPRGSMLTKKILYESVKSTLPAQLTTWSLKATTCVFLPIHSVATHLAHLSKDRQTCAARASTHHLIIPFLDGGGRGQMMPISQSGNILARPTMEIHILPRRCCSISNWMQSSQGLPFLHSYPKTWDFF